jgi:Rho GDP-dissociation inhibitor
MLPPAPAPSPVASPVPWSPPARQAIPTNFSEILNPDAGDESLQRYKESLGLGGGKDLSDPNDPRVCIIFSLSMESPGRAPVTIDLSTPGSEKSLKGHPFKIKEGAKFNMAVTFKVQHEVLSGLHYVQSIKRKGIRVRKDSEMIVSFGLSLSPNAPGRS